MYGKLSVLRSRNIWERGGKVSQSKAKGGKGEGNDKMAEKWEKGLGGIFLLPLGKEFSKGAMKVYNVHISV